MQLISPDLKIDFLGYRKIAFVVSAVALTCAIGLVAGKGIKLGIDFSGGVEVQVQFDESLDIANLRSSLEALGYRATVQSFGERAGDEFLVRVPQLPDTDAVQVATEIRSSLESEYAEQGVVIQRVEVVGPKVGEELRTQGLLSILFALVGILIYVTFRFELRYAVGAIAALVHDVVLVVGLFSLTGKEFSLPTIAALLTIIGYSLNDTIVVFDRIRENRNRARRADFEVVINQSVNETLSRTLLTSITTLLTVVCLLLFTQSGTVIHSFAFALMAGVLVGTYSSVFVASPVLLLWERLK